MPQKPILLPVISAWERIQVHDELSASCGGRGGVSLSLAQPILSVQWDSILFVGWGDLVSTTTHTSQVPYGPTVLLHPFFDLWCRIIAKIGVQDNLTLLIGIVGPRSEKAEDYFTKAHLGNFVDSYRDKKSHISLWKVCHQKPHQKCRIPPFHPVCECLSANWYS